MTSPHLSPSLASHRRLRHAALAIAASAALLAPPAVTPALAQPGRPVPAPLAAAPATPATAPRPVAFTLRQLGQTEPRRLLPLDGGHTVPFSVRADEVVTRLVLRLDLGLSSELALQQALLRVTVNDETVAELPVERDGNVARMSREIEIDPRLLSDHNRIGVALAMPRERLCNRVDRERLWAQVLPESLLTMTVAPLPVAADLALLPAPFFDDRDNRRLDLAMVLPEQPGARVLQAAGVLASWFGVQASYRGATFRSQLGGALPASHAVVLATPQSRVPGIVLPPIDGPTLAVAEHPGQSGAKLLLVLGRDADELKWAADALATGRLGRAGDFRGERLRVGPPQAHAPRKPYDAPRWLPTDRPVRFDEIERVSRLSGVGPHPAPLDLTLRLPPDLHFARQARVPVDLRWYHTPPPQADRSGLHLAFNGTPIRSFTLEPAGRFGLPDGIGRQHSGAGADLLEQRSSRVAVPGGLVSRLPESRFSLRFDYDAPIDDPCATVQAGGQQRTGIDGGSTIDFSGVPHFIGLPDLAAFANSAFPYSRLADLAGTAVLLPDAPEATEIDVYLDLMGHAGRSTGTAGVAVQVAFGMDTLTLQDRDLVLIGTPTRQPLLRHWADHLPMHLDARSEPPPPSLWRRLTGLLPGQDGGPLPGYRTAAGGAAMLGFESPLAGGHTVVALTGSDNAQLRTVSSLFIEPALIARTRGAATLIESDGLRSIDGGVTYHVGNVGLFDRLRYTLAQQPLTLALLSLLLAVVLALTGAAQLRRLAARRLVAADAPMPSDPPLMRPAPEPRP
ncbi:cellulose biosynthesis cyclic di-GMP-binding regulatory protein BcsB [Leptothrix discophora]|uniref:Cyclic di-GMP-binding protein n=1 Tax=Leptothrix discophora TaxID=89 RepID=A0ABT9G8P1_LEPDI|nr:cellulose biosynthesis cyclic di-GMP-binding regulatory protein BcsB [Leptothrix discophora]MDP4302840.1 cellulose biosynthesis cyclic di-GMP-binding regulatory protein BcsB [Leptothrix discophora]